MLQYNMRCYFNVCSKGDVTQLNLLHVGILSEYEHQPNWTDIKSCVTVRNINKIFPKVAILSLKYWQ